ncbi:hypothetical protein ABGB17_29230 [Sphaerisporangium sp. B11E5]
MLYRIPGALKVMASCHDGRWYFTWGRGRDQRARALADDAADQIMEAAR